MITTPFGDIKLYADGICVTYEAVKWCFSRSPCKGKPVAGCYRIEIPIRNYHSVTCVIEPTIPNIANTGDSGECYLNSEFIKDSTILTIGMEDENPAFSSIRTPLGLQANIKQPVDRLVFGVAWATDYEGSGDVRTWFAADPTICFKY